MEYFKLSLISLFFLFYSQGKEIYSQQVPDTSFYIENLDPVYQLSKGPVIFIDEGHQNFHTKEGRYKPFANILEQDGYRVRSYPDTFDLQKLNQCKILVVSNAIHVGNTQAWHVPVFSAFTQGEIRTIKQWVNEGGRLFLIADHMPFAGAAADLAEALGFTFTNGFAMNKEGRGNSEFSIKENTLHENAITKGRNHFEALETIISYTGQAFTKPNDAYPILTFDKYHTNIIPDTAWVFDHNASKFSAEGMCQGAYKTFGKGRIVVFGEAAMFTAQLVGPKKQKSGMNSKEAKENYKLLLNIIHWLDGILN